MSSVKGHNLTVRITEDIKKELEIVAEEAGISTSEYVRRLLRENLDQKQNKNKGTQVEERLKKLEQRQTLEVSGLESKFMMALGYIFSVDTGDQIHKIINDTMQYMRTQGYSPEVLDGMSRDEREQVFMDLYGFFNSHFAEPPSEVAYLTVEAIFITYLSFVYPSPIFMTTPFSLNLINRLVNLKSYYEIAKTLEE